MYFLFKNDFVIIINNKIIPYHGTKGVVFISSNSINFVKKTRSNKSNCFLWNECIFM